MFVLCKYSFHIASLELRFVVSMPLTHRRHSAGTPVPPTLKPSAGLYTTNEAAELADFQAKVPFPNSSILLHLPDFKTFGCIVCSRIQHTSTCTTKSSYGPSTTAGQTWSLVPLASAQPRKYPMHLCGESASTLAGYADLSDLDWIALPQPWN